MRSSIYLYSVDNLAYNYPLPKPLIDHINKYKIEEKRRISLANYSYLAMKLKELGLDINTISFTNNGKPIISGAFISMSHSNSLFGFMISDSECGLDIEQIISEKRFNLANRILNDIELENFQKSTDKSLFLTVKWCLKEAYSKQIGTGLTADIYNKNINGCYIKLSNNIVAYLGNEDEAKIYLNNKEI